MILDSLRYWVKEMHVDGLRFDQASVFARNNDTSLNVHDPPIIGDIVSNLVLADVRLIGEPWGAAAAYQMVRAFLHCWHAPFHQTTDDEQHSRHQHQVED